MAEIQLSNGMVALVDDQDAEELSKWKWYAKKGGNTFYAARGIRENGRSSTVYMHKEIVQAKSGHHTDHINGNGLDNRRANLRICTPQENLRNTKSRKGTSVFKGVFRYKNNWYACIKSGGKNIHLGQFETETDAALAYDAAATRIFGEFSRTNF